MQGSKSAEFQAKVRNELMANPPIHRMGLKSGDLYGFAMQGAQALTAGDDDTAFSIFAVLITLDPMNAEYHGHLAEAALNLGHHAMALQSASVLVASKPTSPEGYYLSARACIGLGEPELALEDLAETENLARKSGQSSFYAAAQKLRALVANGAGRA